MPKKEKPTAVKTKSRVKKKIRKKPKSSFFKFIGIDGKEYNLTFKQKVFTEQYFSLRHGTNAAIAAGYSKKTAYSIANQNLNKIEIKAYISFLLEKNGFNNDAVFREHLFLINQSSDLTNKKGAIDMFYKLKGDYAVQKLQVGIDKRMENFLKRQDERLK